MKHDIDEMIKHAEILAKAAELTNSFSMFHIALATLKDIKTERVMVPSEPITEQLKAMFDCGDDAPWIDLYKATIKASPKSHIEELMESE